MVDVCFSDWQTHVRAILVVPCAGSFSPAVELTFLRRYRPGLTLCRLERPDMSMFHETIFPAQTVALQGYGMVQLLITRFDLRVLQSHSWIAVHFAMTVKYAMQ